MSDRTEKFQWLVKNKPQANELLSSKDGNPVPVCVERKWNDRDPCPKMLMYVNALIDSECTGWYLTGIDTQKALKVLIMPDSQDILIDSNDGRIDNLSVAGLRVVRHNERGTALITELPNMF